VSAQAPQDTTGTYRIFRGSLARKYSCKSI